MATKNDSALEPPVCSVCELEMEFVSRGTEEPGLIGGSEVEYHRFSCPKCGQAARFERSDPDEDWSRVGV